MNIKRAFSVGLRRSVSALLILALGVFAIPGVPAFATANFPTLFGPFAGDCTTPSNTSATITCTKSNGNSFASMAFQAASNVAITGGNIVGTTISGATGSFTTGTFSGLVSGVANTFTGLSTQTGGHVVGTADLTATATLTTAQEDVCANFTAAGTITLPTGINGQHVTVSDCTGTASTAAVTVAAPTGQKILTASGPAQSFTYTQNYQGANYVYHTNNTLWTIE